MNITQSLSYVSDSQILSDLQSLGTTTLIISYSTISGAPTVTWSSTPTPEEQALVGGYFQQNNQLRSWN